MNKRQLKKQIKGLATGLAVDCAAIGALNPEMPRKEVRQLVEGLASTQQKALRRLSISFDKSERDFASRREYRAARSLYMRQALAKLSEEFNTSLEDAVKKLNALAADKKK